MIRSRPEDSLNRPFVSLLPLPKKGERLPVAAFFAAVLTIYLLSRLINLTIVPIFTDEAIYLRWAQIALRDPQFRFISLTDGKQPMFVWLAMVAMRYVSDPLVAGRVVSALSGLVSLVAVWLLARELFGRRSGYFASLTYLVLPINLLYDRMALMESLLFTLGTLSVFFGILLAKHQRLDLALILGALLGGALLTKSPGIFYLYLFPASLALFPWQKSDRYQRLLIWLVLAGVVFVFAQLYFNILRLSPWLHMIKQKDHTFVLSWSEFKDNPWQWLPGNLRAFRHWIVGYLTWPVILLVVGGSFWRLKKNWPQVSLLLIYFLGPLLASAAFGKVIYARYLMFFVLPLVILAGRGWSLVYLAIRSKLKFSWFSAGLLSLVFFLLALKTDYFLLTDPRKANFPDNDKNQYVDAWPAGYGVAEVVEFLQAKAKQDKVSVATEGTFGLMPNSLELYLVDNPNIEILPYWPVGQVPEEVLARAQDRPTYFVFNETQEIPPDYPLRLVNKYPKGNQEDYLHFFEVIPIGERDSSQSDL